ncbi:discoidin domain-containing protein [Paenibacillus sp. WC2504]|uniref:discoidin domain-containing protein n=1 Tax=Paenibacillus sp. WC2504 TaxID=3461403 RepID=UPI00404547FA
MKELPSITRKKALIVTSTSLALSVLLSTLNMASVSEAAEASNMQSYKASPIVSSANSAQLLLNPPKLIPDSTRNMVGRDIDIEFPDDPAWRAAITAVKIDGYSLQDPSGYSITPGKITVHGIYFGSESVRNISIEAAGYSSTDVMQPILSFYSQNLALNKPVFTSDNALQAGNNAVDGNPATRWESKFADNQFLTVDLGAVYDDITHVVLNWENASGKSYDVQLSVDGSTWTTVYTTNQGESGLLDNVYFEPTKARYVRMNGHTRTTDYGFSLREMEVYGDAFSGIESAPVLYADTTADEAGQPIDITFADDAEWRSTISEVKVNNTVISPSQYQVKAGQLTLNSSLFPEAQTYWISVQATGFRNTVVYQTVFPKGNPGVPTNPPTDPTNPPTNPTNPPTDPTSPPANPGSNLALNKQTASSPDYHRSSADAVDGRLDRRWESAFADNQWMTVDLGAKQTINRVLLNWENAYGKAYTIDVSIDGETWHTVYSTDNGNGDIDDISFSPVEARYVKMNGIKRGTPYGFSLWEFEVYAGTADLIESPTLAVSTTATIGEPVELTFADNAAWRNAVNSIELDGVALSPSQYQLEASKLTLDASLLIDSKPYTITIGATGYKNDSVVQSLTLGSSQNLALNKSTTTSESSLQNSSFAVDGKKDTRWESQHGIDPQWITVDLGEATEIKRVVLNWENAAAKAYKVEVSSDGATWTTVYATNNGHEGIANLLIKRTEARYVKVTGTERTTQYGYSLFELEVY